MKYVIIFAVLLVTFQHRDTISHFLNPQRTQLPPELQQVAQQADVVLYATSWCGYCAKARNFFSNNNIPYLEYDIENSHEGKRQYDALGGRGVPLMVINGNIIRGFSPERIRKAF